MEAKDKENLYNQPYILKIDVCFILKNIFIYSFASSYMSKVYLHPIHSQQPPSLSLNFLEYFPLNQLSKSYSCCLLDQGIGSPPDCGQPRTTTPTRKMTLPNPETIKLTIDPQLEEGIMRYSCIHAETLTGLILNSSNFLNAWCLAISCLEGSTSQHCLLSSSSYNLSIPSSSMFSDYWEWGAVNIECPWWPQVLALFGETGILEMSDLTSRSGLRKTH